MVCRSYHLILAVVVRSLTDAQHPGIPASRRNQENRDHPERGILTATKEPHRQIPCKLEFTSKLRSSMPPEPPDSSHCELSSTLTCKAARRVGDILHTQSNVLLASHAAGMAEAAERRWNTRYGAYGRLSAICRLRTFFCFCFLFLGYGELKLDFTSSSEGPSLWDFGKA